MRYVILYGLLIVSSYAIAQISGRVVDSKSGQPLAYVHIGVIGKNLGTISRENGFFSLDPANFSEGDLITFSMIGYGRTSVPVTELKEGMIVRLNSQTTYLKPVEIPGERIKTEAVYLGRVDPSKWTTGQSGLKSYGFGGEWGVEIDPKDEKYFLTKVRLHAKANTVDSILFRINLYTIRDGLPDSSLLTTEVFTTSYRGDKWISADITTQNLTIAFPFVASVELVRIWFSSKSENQIFYSHSSGEQGRVFARKSSLDTWIEGGVFPVTINVEAVKVEE